MSAVSPPTQERAVLHVGGLQYTAEKTVGEQVVGNRLGVLAVDANRVATVSFDSSETSNGLALSGSSVIGALNAVALKRLLLPRRKQSGKT
jgi:hypothetical protein